jgi:hypothetical protein
MFSRGGWWDVWQSDVLVKCAQYLVIAVECSDSRIQPWLQDVEPPWELPEGVRKRSLTILQIGQIYKAVQLASTAIHAKVRFYVFKRVFLVI